jgi:GTPase SAR1 family protein
MQILISSFLLLNYNPENNKYFNKSVIMGGSIGKKKSKIIIVGLDNSGKSTMINMLKPKKVSINYIMNGF